MRLSDLQPMQVYLSLKGGKCEGWHLGTSDATCFQTIQSLAAPAKNIYLHMGTHLVASFPSLKRISVLPLDLEDTDDNDVVLDMSVDGEPEYMKPNHLHRNEFITGGKEMEAQIFDINSQQCIWKAKNVSPC